MSPSSYQTGSFHSSPPKEMPTSLLLLFKRKPGSHPWFVFVWYGTAHQLANLLSLPSKKCMCSLVSWNILPSICMSHALTSTNLCSTSPDNWLVSRKESLLFPMLPTPLLSRATVSLCIITCVCNYLIPDLRSKLHKSKMFTAEFLIPRRVPGTEEVLILYIK